MQEHSGCMMMTDDDAKAHVVFYSVCQAFFYLFNARYKEFVTSNNGECIFIVHAHRAFNNFINYTYFDVF